MTLGEAPRGRPRHRILGGHHRAARDPASAASDPPGLIQASPSTVTAPVLGVDAEAEKDGEVVASDLTHENVTATGDPQVGYFALHVTKGIYTVTLSKSGFETLVVEDGYAGSTSGRLTLVVKAPKKRTQHPRPSLLTG